MGWILWGIVLPLLVVVAGIVALQKRRSGRR
jgi:cytochrome c-type biogenesis protein CcmH/NrfF